MHRGRTLLHEVEQIFGLFDISGLDYSCLL